MTATQRGQPARPWLKIAAGFIFFYLAFPVFVIVPLSFSSARYLSFPPPGFSLQWWQAYLQNPNWTGATLLSLRVAGLAALVSTVLGTAASFTLARRSFAGKSLVYSIILSPMIVPPILMAISLYFFVAPMRLIGNWIVLGLCHALLGLPVVVITVTAALKGFDQTLENAAMSLGADRWQTFLRVTFPLIRPGILVGALFAFLASWDELLIAIYVGGERTKTLPRRIWDGVRFEIDPTIAAVATLLILVTIILLVGIQFGRKKPNG